MSSLKLSALFSFPFVFSILLTFITVTKSPKPKSWVWSLNQPSSLSATSTQLPTKSYTSCLLLDCTLQACTPCSCPALKPKKEPGYSNRGISGLWDRGIWPYTSEARSWSNTPLLTADGRQDVTAIFATRGRTRLPFLGWIDVRWAQGYQGLIKPYN